MVKLNKANVYFLIIISLVAAIASASFIHSLIIKDYSNIKGIKIYETFGINEIPMYYAKTVFYIVGIVIVNVSAVLLFRYILRKEHNYFMPLLVLPPLGFLYGGYLGYMHVKTVLYSSLMYNAASGMQTVGLLSDMLVNGSMKAIFTTGSTLMLISFLIASFFFVKKTFKIFYVPFLGILSFLLILWQA
jgi:hypothetical protein